MGARILELRRLLRSDRKPLPYKDFAALIKDETQVSISYESIRRYELNERVPDVNEAAAIAAVDPKGRGLAWLAGDLKTKPTQRAPRGTESPDPIVERIADGLSRAGQPKDARRKRRAR